MTEPTGEDRLGRSFGRPVTEPTGEDRLGRSFGRPVTEPTGEPAWVMVAARCGGVVAATRRGAMVRLLSAGRSTEEGMLPPRCQWEHILDIPLVVGCWIDGLRQESARFTLERLGNAPVGTVARAAAAQPPISPCRDP